MNQDISILFEDLKYVKTTPPVGVWFCGLVDGWVFLLTFWYLAAYLKHLSPLQGYFWNMSIFDDSRAIWVLFRKWVVSENRILLRNGWPTPGYSDLVLGGEVPRLNHGPICFPIQNT